MKTLRLLLAALLLSTSLIGCKKHHEHTYEQDVYAAGNQALPDYLHVVAAMWKNNSPTVLSDGSTNATVYSMFIAENDIYMAGEDKGAAVLWKNGVATKLTVENSLSYALSVYVKGVDVYVCGKRSGQNITEAVVWKNGVATVLNPPQSFAAASSVYVSGQDVYVAGEMAIGNGKVLPTLWKNGIAASLTDGSINGNAVAVVVASGDVYVAGLTNNASQSIIWKNGVATNITGTFTCTGGFVSGSDVYFSGFQTIGGQLMGTIWKNGTAINLTQGMVHSVFVSGKDVYAGGTSGASVATIWKNGIPKTLPGPGDVNAIFVK